MLCFRDHGRIGNQIVDVLCRHRPRIAQVVDLHRRRTAGEYAGLAVLGISLQIDGDIEFDPARQQRHVAI